MPGGYRTAPEKVDSVEALDFLQSQISQSSFEARKRHPFGDHQREIPLYGGKFRKGAKDSGVQGECDEAIKVHFRKPSRLAQLVIALDFTAEPPEDREALAL